MIYRNSWLCVLSGVWDPNKQLEVKQNQLGWLEMSFQECEINSKKQGMLNVRQGKITHS